MAAVINTNYLSLVAQNNLNKSQSALGTAIERLSSGLRINSAKDDAAGMAIANRFTANVKGLTQAARNANDGISLAQTTEGASAEVNTHLQRVRELAVQAGNGNYSQEQLDSMQDEINQRLSDINRISEQTDFNGVKVLSANAKPLTLQVGANDGETITLNLSEISVKTLGLNGFNVNGKGVTDNRTATVTDVIAQGGVPAGSNTRSPRNSPTPPPSKSSASWKPATWSPSARAQAPPPTPTTLPPARSRTPRTSTPARTSPTSRRRSSPPAAPPPARMNDGRQQGHVRSRRGRQDHGRRRLPS